MTIDQDFRAGRSDSSAAELAILLSVAAQIDLQLLRVVRLEITPNLDVGAEADLWFSDWVEGRGAESIRLNHDIVDSLRELLASRLASSRDDKAWRLGQILRDVHRGWPPALQLEEQLTWAAIRVMARTADVSEISTLLQTALRAVVLERRIGVADWFASAWHRLPHSVRRTLEAWQLLQVASDRSKIPPFTNMKLSIEDVYDLRDIIGDRNIAVSHNGDTLLLNGHDDHGVRFLPVPDTRPIVVRAQWRTPHGTQTETLLIDPDAAATLSTGASVVHLSTGRGLVYEVSPLNNRDAESVEPDQIDIDLRTAITRIARTPSLLIGCSFDGTIAPISARFEEAFPLPEAIAALRSLAALPQTAVAVISARALRDLVTLSRLPSEVHLVGSHGSEFDVGFVHRLAPELVELHQRLRGALSEIVMEHPGVRLEVKPAGITVHIRDVDHQTSLSALESIRQGPASWSGIYTLESNNAIELSVIEMHKGVAIDTLRTQFGASAVLFLGDDTTDERAFERLQGPDLAIKIGPEETQAHYRVADPEAAVRCLAMLLETRRNWLFGERAVPIERHSMLADGNTVALVTPGARITWLCHPRPDSQAVFADLLGGSPAGHFSVGPARGGLPLGHRYRPGTMTVETRWSGLLVTDWLDGDRLLRRITGNAPVVIEFAPRPGFGQNAMKLQPLGDGLLILGSNEPSALHSPGVTWEISTDHDRDTAIARLDLNAAGGEVLLELRFGTHDLDDHPMSGADRLEAAERPWREWAASLELPARFRDAVLRSALTLRGLCHRPTGGILAAATTSLPETLGGVRNWDYRYCWLRDASMTALALVDLGSITEAEAFLRWIDGCVERTGGYPERLHPLYAIDGHLLGAEAVIDTLPGYSGSRPVRVGNATNTQVHLGIFGPIADLVLAVADRRGSIEDFELALVESMVQAVERRWHEPDDGHWGGTGTLRRHHVYSKVMCWMTVDRAIHMLERHGDGQYRPEWMELRDRIAANVLEHGWNEEVQAYTVAYGHTEMDASSLWIGLSGLLADDDPRFLSTVLRIESELRSGPVVYRYLWDDGLPGKEGGFYICTAWLIEAYLRTGRHSDAEELFHQMLETAGPTGLLPEQYDPDNERSLGNHPQAYSHLGLIRCATLLSQLA